MSDLHPPATQHPHPSPAPAAPATDAPPDPPLANWSFPFAPSGKDDPTDPMTYMKALGCADDGFYPIGANGLWHGGVHFGDKTGHVLNQRGGVRAIADGDVVAYRLDKRYPELEYDDKRVAAYSTSFVLVRHKLQLPPAQKKDGTPQANGSAPPTAAAKAAPPDETLTFFSLYMHLLDWAGYQAAMKAAKDATGAKQDASAPAIEPMPYWKGDRLYRVGDKATDKQEMPKPKAPEPDPIDRDLMREFIDAGFVVPPPEPPREPPPPPPAHGLRVRDAKNGKIIGLLPKGTELTVVETDDTKTSGWARIGSITRGQAVGPVAGKPASTNVAVGWVYVKQLDLIVDPKPLDQVVVLDKPVRVKAGDVVGYVGQYQRHKDASVLPPQSHPRPLLHLEVFAGPELRAFVDKSRQRAKTLPGAKPFVEIQAGALLVTTVPDPDVTLTKSGLRLVPIGDAQGGRWVKVQPKSLSVPPTPHGQHHGHKPKPHEIDEGSPLWVESSLANGRTSGGEHGWKDFPLSLSRAQGPGVDFRDVFRLTDVEKPGMSAKDEQGRRWWNVTVGTKDGGTRQGWVCEKGHPLVTLCGPWDWPGFEFVDHHGTKPVEMLKRYLYVADLVLTGEDASEFEASASQVNASELITKLEKALDRNHDGKITAQELAAAQQTPWSAEAISHLVVRSETEWGCGIGKWEELSPLMKGILGRWKSEIQRIEKLQWWEQVARVDGFPKEPSPWHFHPVGLVGNFIQKPCSCNRDVTEEELDSILPSDVKLKGLFYKAHDVSVHGFDRAKFLAMLNRYLREHDMMTCVRKAHFLSQMVHECDGLRTNEEYGNSDGSIPSGWYNYHGGPNFHGRGLIQLTHKENYMAYGSFVKDLTIGSDPNKISHSVEHTVHSACWYWRKGSRWGDINPKCDNNDFFAVTIAVNGGFRHIGDRFVVLNRVANLLGAGACATNPGLIFSDYRIDRSSLAKSSYYKNYPEKIRAAIEGVNEKKYQI